MRRIISLRGIDEAISNLNYLNAATLKSKLVLAIRGFYEDESSVQSLEKIDAEILIKTLWDTGDDPAIIKAKRKNLSSIKSSVNADLKTLYKEGNNPEGITVGRNNVFVMDAEAKDQLLTSFTSIFASDAASSEAVNLGQIAQVLNTLCREILSNPEALPLAGDSNVPIQLEALRTNIEGLADKVGLAGRKPDLLSKVLEDEEDLQSVVGGDRPVDDAEIADGVVAQEEEIPAAEVLDELELEEVPEQAELDEALEEVEQDDVLEGVEVLDDIDEEKDTDRAEGEGKGSDRSQDMGLPIGNFDEGQDERDDTARKNRVLAEAFDGYLGTTERFFNQYLLIAQGAYIAGSKTPQKDEQPERRVRLAPFFMGKFPVTNALFEIFVEKTGYKTTAEKLGFATVYYGRLHKKVDEKTGLVKYTFNAAVRCETVHGACWYHPFGPDSTLSNKKNHPVVQVSLKDAMAFAAWTGKRLPTENEWEAAARTAHGYAFPWGNEMKDNSCNIEESSVADTTPVDRHIEFENDFGIVDAIGNVLEWTMDTCEPPLCVKNSSTYRIVKGGSWISGNDVRLFSRFKWHPESPSNILGFRCVAV